MKRNLLMKKLKGYHKTDRERFLLLCFQVLTLEEYIVYELGIAITDWDERHVDTFGTFYGTNDDMAEILGWTGSTVSKLKKRLIAKEFFVRDGDRFRAKDFEKSIIRKKPVANRQEENAYRQHQFANRQHQLANKQGFRGQKNDYSLVSFKDELSVSDIEDINNSLKEDASLDDIPF